MADNTMNLPKGFVLDNIPEGFEIENPNTLSSGEPSVVTMQPMSEEEIAWDQWKTEREKSRAYQEQLDQKSAAWLNSTPGSVIVNEEGGYKTPSIQELDDETLLSSYAYASKPMRDDPKGYRSFSQRKPELYNELKRREFPDQFIRDYIDYGRSAPSFMDMMATESPEIAGGTIGSYIGQGLMPQAPIAGGAIGATMGTAVGRLGKEAYFRMFEPYRAKKGKELAKTVSAEAIADGLAEYGMGWLWKGMSGPMKNDMLKDAKRLSDELEQSAAGGIDPKYYPLTAGKNLPRGYVIRPTPAQQSANQSMEVLENILEGSFTGQGPMHDVKGRLLPAAYNQYADQKLLSISNGLVGNIDIAQLGGIADDSINGAEIAWRKIYKRFYRPVDQAAKGQKVNIVNMKSIARGLADKIQSKQVLKGVAEGDKVIENILDLADEISFENAVENRSFLLELSRKLKKSGDNRLRSIVDRAVNSLDKSMEDTAKSIGGDTYENWRRANHFYRYYKKKFDAKILDNIARRVAEGNEQKVVSTLFREKSPTRIQNVKNILLGRGGKNANQIMLDKHTWEELRWGWVQEQLNNPAVIDADGVIQGEAWKKSLDRMGDKALREMFTAQEISNLYDIAKLGRIIQRKPQGEGGAILIKILQAGAVGKLASEGNMPEAMATIFSPYVIARFYTSKVGNALLTETSEHLTKYGRIPMGMAGRMITELYREKATLERERKRYDAIRRKAENSALGQNIIQKQKEQAIADLQRAREMVK